MCFHLERAVRQTNKQTNQQTNKQTNKQTTQHPNKQTNKQTAKADLCKRCIKGMFINTLVGGWAIENFRRQTFLTPSQAAKLYR